MASIQEPGGTIDDSDSVPGADALAVQLFEALAADAPDRLRALLRSASVLTMSELCSLLDDQGKGDFQMAKAYCERWDTEGPPRPAPQREPQPIQRDYNPYERIEESDYDPFDLSSRMLPRRSHAMPPQSTWDANDTQAWRGRLRASLRVVAPDRSSPRDPNGLKPPPRVNADAPTHPGADLRQLIGWPAILEVLGIDAKDRNGRNRVKDLNSRTNGPIKQKGKRGVIANHGLLVAWWRTAADQADDAARSGAAADRSDAATQALLQNAGERRHHGFHDKEHPSMRRRPR